MKVSNTQYAKTLYEMLQGKSRQEAEAVISSFASFLVRKKASAKVEKIMESFSKIWNNKNGIVDCEVVSMEKLSENDLKKIGDFVAKSKKAKSVNVKNTSDKDVKGGIIIRTEDEIIDMSIDGNLKRLKKHLIS